MMKCKGGCGEDAVSDNGWCDGDCHEIAASNGPFTNADVRTAWTEEALARNEAALLRAEATDDRNRGGAHKRPLA